MSETSRRVYLLEMERWILDLVADGSDDQRSIKMLDATREQIEAEP